MSTPILFGSPRAQKNYIRPRFEGLAPRTTPIGYNKDQSVERAPILPPPPPPIATGYTGWFQRTVDGVNSFSEVSIENYIAASDTMTASSINVAPQAPPGLEPTWESTWVGTFFGTSAVQNGSNTHGYLHVRSTAEPNLNLFQIPQMTFFAYANATTQNNLNDIGPGSATQKQVGVNDKANGYGLRIIGADNLNNAIFNVTRFPFASDTFTNNGSAVGQVVPGITDTSPDNVNGRRDAMATQDLNAAFYVGGTGAPFASIIPFTGTVIKFPFANYAEDTRLTGLDPWGPSPSEAFQGTGVSSTTHGYSLGGVVIPVPTTNTDVMQKYPFTAEGDVGSSNVGNLSIAVNRGHGSATNSTGYLSGGWSIAPQSTPIQTIQAFPFASDTTTTGVSNILRTHSEWGRGTSEA